MTLPDFDHLPDLRQCLLGLIRQIPAGQVTTYGALADCLGDRSAARWVGEFLADPAHHTPCCGCHRVVLKSGLVGRYAAGSADEKRARLCAEGVVFDADRVRLDASRCVLDCSIAPLQQLRLEQDRVATSVDLSAWSGLPRVVAGIDIAYPRPGVARAAYVEYDLANSAPAWAITAESEVQFPYIPGYLTYREAPALVALLQQVLESRSAPDVILVDGNGQLHPRRCGIASYLGVETGLRTIGVGKSLLCGRREREAESPRDAIPITDQGALVGVELASRPGTRPFYVSAGHRIDLASSTRIVTACLGPHRLPEPIFWADRLTRKPDAFPDPARHSRR